MDGRRGREARAAASLRHEVIRGTNELMSWGIDYTGTKDAVIAAVNEDLERIAKGYAGKEEAKDVLAVRDRIVSLVNALELGKDGYGTLWNGAKVSANGSHSVTINGLTSASFSVAVSRVLLKL